MKSGIGGNGSLCPPEHTAGLNDTLCIHTASSRLPTETGCTGFRLEAMEAMTCHVRDKACFEKATQQAVMTCGFKPVCLWRDDACFERDTQRAVMTCCFKPVFLCEAVQAVMTCCFKPALLWKNKACFERDTQRAVMTYSFKPVFLCEAVPPFGGKRAHHPHRAHPPAPKPSLIARAKGRPIIP